MTFASRMTAFWMCQFVARTVPNKEEEEAERTVGKKDTTISMTAAAVTIVAPVKPPAKVVGAASARIPAVLDGSQSSPKCLLFLQSPGLKTEKEAATT